MQKVFQIHTVPRNRAIPVPKLTEAMGAATPKTQVVKTPPVIAMRNMASTTSIAPVHVEQLRKLQKSATTAPQSPPTLIQNSYNYAAKLYENIQLDFENPDKIKDVPRLGRLSCRVLPVPDQSMPLTLRFKLYQLLERQARDETSSVTEFRMGGYPRVCVQNMVNNMVTHYWKQPLF